MLLLLLCYYDLFADFPQLCVESEKIKKREVCSLKRYHRNNEMSVCVDSYHVDI